MNIEQGQLEHPGGGSKMQWTKPAYTEIRYGFEITMYILNR
jgi:coenzyme PQQ precursor peptide PqqA